jgi:hypothetical protein
MDWYSYEEKYRDENDEEQTRIQYKYVQGTMSDEEMKEGGYTHLGKTYLSDDKYYSLGGAILDYDKSDMQQFGMVANVMAADFFTITAVNAFKEGSDFWNKYSEYISTGSNAANAIANFMDASSKFGNFIKGVSNALGYIQIGKDAYSAFITKTMTTEGFIDATVNVISLLGKGSGAGFALMYTAAKRGTKGLQRMEREFNNYVKRKVFDPGTWGYGW